MANKYLIVVLLVFVGLVACQSTDIAPPFGFEKPANFPDPIYDFAQNPVTQEGFELGRMLFYDGLLSRDGTVSCGSCHQQSSGFTQHGHDLSHGIDDQLTLRNALPIQNLAWEPLQAWDGGVFNLDLFAIVPIEAHNEMDSSLPEVLDKLRRHPRYPEMFRKAFGSPEITTARFLKALSQFQLMAISANSRYDRYIRNEGVQLTSLELQGLEIFRQKCSSCHPEPLFTDGSFRHNGLAIGNPADKGRGDVTARAEDDYKFRVPSLRNVEVTRPYMHDGRLRNLQFVLEHYDHGVVDHPHLDPLLKQHGRLGIPLSAEEQRKIIAFLHTLTDEEFLSNPKLSEFF
jgi:cytochrome c peroxidase